MWLMLKVKFGGYPLLLHLLLSLLQLGNKVTQGAAATTWVSV